MIKRTLYFGSEAYLSTKDAQMQICLKGESSPSAKVPIEDIGVVVLDHYQVTITQTLLSRLLANNTAVVTCNDKHMPQGLLLNLDGHTHQQHRFAHQIEASQALKKNLWQQTVKAKINNQAAVLQALGFGTENMEYWASQVAPADPENYEGRAAANYWKLVFEEYIENFRRGRYEPEPNNLLNYGYAILRAITARNLVGSGLLPTLGIHHHNKYNAYCLADDIMEPYRPYLDLIVLDILQQYDDVSELTPNLKRELLQIASTDVYINKKNSPLMVAMQQTTASLSDCFLGNLRLIKYPKLL